MLKIFTRRFITTIVKSKKTPNGKFEVKLLCNKKLKSAKFSEESHIMHRQWEQNVNEIQTSEMRTNTLNQKYRFMSYNILAQDLLVEHIELYAGIPHETLVWDFRQKKLKLEIDELQPDIVCLQEMQYNHLKHLVREISGKRQMEYIFKKKTGVGTDGCAIIYDRRKFKLIKEQVVEYYTDGSSTLNRLNIAVLAKFLVQDDPTKSFVVATTHLLYNPKREDIRIAQVNVLMRALFHFANDNNGARLPIILSGDFNFTPDTRAFKLLITERKFIKGCEEETFQMDPINFGEDGASTFQDMWITVDYILKSKAKNNERSIEVYSIYKLPTIEDCCRNGKIPNYTLGSDHFALAMIFTIS